MLIRVATDVAAPADQVYAVYADYRRWSEFFPTIRGVRLVGRDQDGLSLAIDHVEGTVPNHLLLEPPNRIVLNESKRNYNATFVNTFHHLDAGTRFEIEGNIRLKGARRLLAPVIRPYARRLMRRLQLVPVKTEAERRLAADRPAPAPGGSGR
jgi:ribosome-associated toxin RatA of RatAB toxin-antitoxin module